MRRIRGLSILEYAGLMVGVAVALFMMQFYLQRVIGGHVKSAADTFGFGRQYAPGQTNAVCTGP
jgi:hypothetical protein